MRPENKVFFADKGITATSANYVSNKAKESLKQVQSELNGIRFFGTKVSVLGTEGFTTLATGTDSATLNSVEEKLALIGKTHSLIAWLREAIKAKEAETQEVSFLSEHDYAKEHNLTVPKEPERQKSLTLYDAIGELTIKERQEYFYLEAYAASVGSYIHPDGKFADARKQVMSVVNNPAEIKVNGVNTMVYNYTPSVNIEEIESVNEKLMVTNRELNARLNSIKHRLETRVTDYNTAEKDRFAKEYDVYAKEHRAFREKADVWKLEKMKEVKNLKIDIPNDLKELFNKFDSKPE